MFNFINSSPTVTNCTFSGNSAADGGGMFNFNSSPTVTNCSFSGNVARRGGGMFNQDSSPPIAESFFCGNEPDHIFGPWTDEGGNEFLIQCGCDRADLDGSGDVDFNDILRVLDAWGNEGGPEDLDGSGTVDFQDILTVLDAWGPCQ